MKNRRFESDKEFLLERMLDKYIAEYERSLKPRLELPPRQLMTSRNYFKPEKQRGFFR